MDFFNSLFGRFSRRIFCDSSSSSARAAFLLGGHKLTQNPEEAELLWIRKGYQEYFPVLQTHQLINHFPNQPSIINKGYLTENLKNYANTLPPKGADISEFYPESYRLYDPKERRKFFSQLPKTDRPDNLWIYKPGNSSRGRGIEIMWRFNKLRRTYKKWGNRPIKDKDQQGIIQRYIQNPLLLEGRKSELRVYWMIASLDPFMVLMFPEATVRLNSLPYQLDNFDNQLIHVTNVYQQKNHPDYDPSLTLKWSFEELRQYVSNDLGLATPDFIEARLLPQISRILETVARAGRPSLYKNYPHPGDSFSVYGADIILDENLTPWLTEIQKGPGLSFDDPIKRHVIPPMLSEAARIAFEIRKRRTRGRALTKLTSVDRFQWVVNDLEPELVAEGSTPSPVRGRGIASSDDVTLPS